MTARIWQHREVRDLAYALKAPCILEPSEQVPSWKPEEMAAHYAAAQGWLARLDENPEPLLEHIAQHPRSNRLGLYYEALLSFWFKAGVSYELLAHDLPVNAGGQTLGAFDFIVKRATEITHIEVAVKFYLGVRGVGDWADWIGPNQNDSLALKLDKMLNKQLRLSEHPQASTVLSTAGIPRPTQRKLWIKGIFFRPHNSKASCKPQGGSLATGIWLPQNALAALQQETPAARWFRRTKPDWVAPTEASDPPAAFRTAAQMFEETAGPDGLGPSSPQMWSRVEKSDLGWQESLRVFVVTDGWEKDARGKVGELPQV